jgi:hypothetical protein
MDEEDGQLDFSRGCGDFSRGYGDFPPQDHEKVSVPVDDQMKMAGEPRRERRRIRAKASKLLDAKQLEGEKLEDSTRPFSERILGLADFWRIKRKQFLNMFCSLILGIKPTHRVSPGPGQVGRMMKQIAELLDNNAPALQVAFRHGDFTADIKKLAFVAKEAAVHGALRQELQKSNSYNFFFEDGHLHFVAV